MMNKLEASEILEGIIAVVKLELQDDCPPGALENAKRDVIGYLQKLY